MTDRAALAMREMAAVRRAEAELRPVVRQELAAFLAEVREAVLYGDAPILAAADGNRALQISAAAFLLVRRRWFSAVARITDRISAIFSRRYKGAGGGNLDARLATYVGSIAAKLDAVADDVHKAVLAVVNEAVKEGLTAEQTAERVSSVLDPAEWEPKVDLVTVTEAVGAYNAGAEAGHVDAGTATHKEWLSLRDGRVRPTHVDADGQRVGIQEMFTVGGFRARVPGDENLPPHEACNCRCVAIYISEDGSLVASTGKMDPMAEETPLPNGWRGPIAALNRPTGDDRQLNLPETGLRTREYPMSFTRQHVGPGQDVFIGTVDRAWVGEDGLLYGEGSFDLGGDDGREAARLVGSGQLTTCSIQPDEVTFEQQFFSQESGLQVPFAEAVNEELNDLNPGYAVRDVMTDWRLASNALVSIPAFDEARIEPVYDYAPQGAPMNYDDALAALLGASDEEDLASLAQAVRMAHASAGETAVATPEEVELAAEIVASASGGQIFNSKFFADPKLTGPSPLTVDEDGRVYGHVATWGACYMAFGGGSDKPCVSVPFSNTDYDRFKVHGAKMDTGEIMPVGAITFGDGHYAAGGLRASQKMYAEIASVAAKVTCGEDEFGIWVSGEVVDEFRHRAYDLLLSPLSGHWEPDGDVGGQLEMLAAHVVVAPGFKVPRLVASIDSEGNYLAVEFAGVARPAAADPIVAAVQADRRAQKALKKLGLDPESRAAAALARLTKEI